MGIISWIFILTLINWGLPLLIFLYPLIMMWVWKDFEYYGRHESFPVFILAKKDLEPWHARLWRDWAGVGLYGFMCIGSHRQSKQERERTILHEATHCRHQVMLGLMFWVAYLGHSIFIWLFQPNKHAYLDNWSERLARKNAGQPVDIPPPGGKWTDRWPWW